MHLQGIRCTSEQLMLWNPVLFHADDNMLGSQTPLWYTRTSNLLNVRPQGCQAREHRRRQQLQLVAVENQCAAAKQKAEKIISTRRQDSICICKVSDVHQNSFCFEIQSWFYADDNMVGSQTPLSMYTNIKYIKRETSRMSGPRTPPQAAAAAGCLKETDAWGNIETTKVRDK